MDPGKRKAQLARAEAALTVDDRERAAKRSLDDALGEAVAMYILTLAELNRRCSTREELLAQLTNDAPVDLSALWRAKHDVRSR